MGDHYLPRFFLNGFSKPAKQSKRSPGIVRYEIPSDGTPKHLTIATVANETGMYGELEPILQREIEQPANGIIEKLRLRVGPISSSDVPHLARYVMAAIRRVPDGRNQTLASMPQVAASVRQNYEAELEQLRRSPGGKGSAHELEKKLAVLAKVAADPPEWLWRKTLLPKNFPQTVGALSTMNWCVHATPQEMQLIIGDVPVIRDRRVGLNESAAMWLLPISSNRMISISNYKPDDFKPLIPAQTVTNANLNMVFQATRFVFARDPDEWISNAIVEATQRRSSSNVL